MTTRGEKRRRRDDTPDGISEDGDLDEERPQGNDLDELDNDILASQPTRQPWRLWTVEDVAKKLEEKEIPHNAIKQFREHKIDGSVLGQLTLDMMKDSLQIMELGVRLKIKNFLSGLGLGDFDGLNNEGTKVFNDPVHGHMEFHPLCVEIIDTPQFQRLRYLKQLGACYFVYPGAAHNRFEHSLGVSHLAGQLVRALKRRQPGLEISDADILCVEIAGLCHDLGHGPFSHVFDNQFIPYTRPDIKWKHEQASVDMFDYMVTSNKLVAAFEKHGLKEQDRNFIKEQIIGKPLSGTATEEKWRFEEKKKFLYDIVANQRNGVDVDKWDYFKRDCHHLGMTSSFDHTRFIHFARVICVEEKGKKELQICVRDKEAFNMYQMFHTRFTLHRKAYQHRVTQAVNIMLVGAMIEANDFIRIPGDNGQTYKMSECIDHMDAYTNLTDEIFHRILLSQGDRNLDPARSILLDIQRRRLYKCIGESVPLSDTSTLQHSVEDIKKEILEELAKEERDSLRDTFVVQLVNLDYGKKSANPVNDLRFFSKTKLNEAKPVKASEVSHLMPQVRFKEQLVRVFVRYHDDKEVKQRCVEILGGAFNHWCEKNTMKKPQEMANIAESAVKPEQSSQEMTPPRPDRALDLPSSAMKGRQKLAF